MRPVRAILGLSGLVFCRDHTIYAGGFRAQSVVIDLGANRGDFSKRMADLGCTVYAVEPMTELFATIPDSARIKKFNVAITARDCPVKLNISSIPVCHSILELPPTECVTTVEVPGMRFDTFLVENGIHHADLVKIDIEGAEVAFFDSLHNDQLCSIDQLTVEFHDFNRQVAATKVESIKHRLGELGFHRIGFRDDNMDVLFINLRNCGVSRMRYVCWLLTAKCVLIPYLKFRRNFDKLVEWMRTRFFPILGRPAA